MIERFTLKIPTAIVTQAAAEIVRLHGGATLTGEMAYEIARKCAELYAPQMQVNWGRVEESKRV